MDRSVLREELCARLAGGALFGCAESGTRLVSGREALADILGVTFEELDQKGPAGTLGSDAPEAYSDFFNGSEAATAELELQYRHPRQGLLWFLLRKAPSPDGQGDLVFLRDETALHASRLKIAEAQSKDVENSARLQAAVLAEGHRQEFPFIDYQTTTIPSRLVDGDFLDVLKLSERSADFVLGDVMGKGMDAAITGAMIKFGFARALNDVLSGAATLPDPAAICSAADAMVSPRLLERQSFATLTYARFDAASRVLRFVDCGHTSIIHFSRRTGECWRVKGGNRPLGFTEGQDYRSYLLPVEAGDCFLLYTDGLSECENRWGESFGEERVAWLLKTYADLPAAELASTILRIGFAYSATGFGDDVSLVCIKDRSAGESPEAERATSLDFGGPGGGDFDSLSARLGQDLETWLPGIALEVRSELELALHEAIANIREHAMADGGACEVRWRLHGDLLSIEASYSGPEYDWSSRPSSPLAEFADSGYGRFIMDRAVDSLLVSQGFEDRKRLVMCRRLDRGSEGRST